jgi:hypothetical protein
LKHFKIEKDTKAQVKDNIEQNRLQQRIANDLT